jgi:putative ABC transport system permease protein
MRGFSVVVILAFRNVFKYGRRSAGTFAVVFIGILAIAYAEAFMNGFSDKLVSGFAVAGGHLRVSARGYAARRATCPLDRVVADPGALLAAAAAAALEPSRAAGKAPRFARVEAVPLLRAPCALRASGAPRDSDAGGGIELSANLYLAGADARPGGTLAPPFEASPLAAGRYPSAGERGLVLSASSASRLDAELGERIVVLASDAFGSFGAAELPLLGIAKGAPGPEEGLLDLDSMRDLLGIPSGASELVLYLVDSAARPVDPRLVAPELASMQAAVAASGLEAERWDQSSSAVPAMLRLFDSFALVLFAIFAAVAGTGVANSVMLSIQDRTRDFGTLRAIAFSRRWVEAIVALETLMIGAAASISAAAISWASIAAMGEGGIRLSRDIRGISTWMPEAIAARVDPASLALIVVAGCAFPLLAAAYPLLALGRMRIREALGYI